jgi:clan AA aspartic protease (TIGR02281 family)
MNLALRSLVFAAVVLALASTARGEIYRWTDAEGRVHATQRIDQVPPAYRNAARESVTARRPVERVHTYSGSPTGAPAPPPRSRGARREIEIPFTKVGTLMRVDAKVNDAVSIPFLIDTGASGVSIPTSYAEKLGVEVRPDTPRVSVTTANGIVARPMIPLRSIEVEGARVEDLAATLDPSLEFGLLGGSFFNNYIYRVDAARSVMTLVPNDQMRGGLGEAEWRARFRTWTDPLGKLETYLRDHPYLGEHERTTLAVRQQQLQAGLSDLEHQADVLGVPQNWREGGV